MKANVLLLCAAAAWLACSGTDGVDRMNAQKSDAEAVNVVRQYVAAHKGWGSKDYSIEKHGTKNRYVIYFIMYLPEQRSAPGNERNPLIAGGGESFAVYYDPAARKVVKEMGFQ